MNNLDLSLGRVTVRNLESDVPKMPNVSKFRATKQRTDGADVHICVGSKTEVARSRTRDVDICQMMLNGYTLDGSLSEPNHHFRSPRQSP